MKNKRDAFSSPKRRLARAKEHIADIKSRTRSFLDTKPYARIVERNVDGLDEHKIKFTADIPDKITDLTYEAIEALRASLDQSIYPVAIACGAKRSDHIHFPIADEATDIDRILNVALKELPPDILALLRAFKPYKAGNKLIWALNRIRRQGAHRIIVPIGTVISGLHVRYMIVGPGGRGAGLRSPIWDSKKDEIVYAVSAPDTHLDYNLDIAFYIAFGPVEGLEGHPVVETLEATSGEVERIILAIKAEARRLCLFG